MFKTIFTVLGSMMMAAAMLAACESKDPPKHPEPLPATTANLSTPSDLPAATTTASRPPSDPTTASSGMPASSAKPMTK